jgi:flagellar biosynthesis protein FlhG
MDDREAEMFDRKNRTETFDQAHGLRRLVAHHRSFRPDDRATHVVAVVSGKGGVGKTMIAVNLAITLSARGHRVVLFDMDMGLANADIVMGVEPGGTWRDVLNGRRRLDEIIVEGPGQVDLVPGVSGVSQMANLSEFERHQLFSSVTALDGRYDVAILDCGAGISRNVVGMAGGADSILVVATPEPTAITDAYAMIKAFAQDQVRAGEFAGSLGVIVNLSESRREGRDAYERLSEVAARFLHLPVSDYGYVLRDEHVPAAIRQRIPVVIRYPRCSASTCVMASAARLSREIGKPEAERGLFYRVMNLFL